VNSRNGDWNIIGTSKTYQLALRDFHPFSSLLNAPITIFNFKIGASIVPEMEEDLEILTFKRAQIMIRGH